MVFVIAYTLVIGGKLGGVLKSLVQESVWEDAMQAAKSPLQALTRILGSLDVAYIGIFTALYTPQIPYGHLLFIKAVACDGLQGPSSSDSCMDLCLTLMWCILSVVFHLGYGAFNMHIRLGDITHRIVKTTGHQGSELVYISFRLCCCHLVYY